MADISAASVKQLRQMTDAPMMACKKALEDAGGDIQKAAELVRERTGAKMDARAGERTAADGAVISYLHAPNPDLPAKVGVLLQLHCETDFVAKGDKFQQLGRDIAMHIAAMKPLVVTEDEVDAEMLDTEREFARKEAVESGKPAEIVDRIIDGKIKKFYAESVLLNQPFVKDDAKTVAEIISDVQAVTGEKIEVARFVRFQVGA
jgi:elongation factor Ts